MPTLAELQQNPLFQRQQARNATGANDNALSSLRNNPLYYLSNVVVLGGVGMGHQTVLNPAGGFGLDPSGKLRVGPSALAVPHHIQVPMLQSPTRGSGAADLADRFSAVQRFPAAAGAAAPQLWITDQQSGCTVLALDWGGGQYSMFHLLPYDNAAFGKLARAAFFVSDVARSAVKNASLRTDATQVVNASLGGGGLPQRYIMLQSQHNARTGHYMQVLGINRNMTWEFYRQIQNMAGGTPVVGSVSLAPWRPWNEIFYRDL
jgi:hypothetical protein